MTTIAETAAILVERAKTVRVLSGEEHFRRRIETTAGEIERLVDELRPLVGFAGECFEQGVLDETPVEISSATAAASLIVSLRELAGTNPSEVVDSLQLVQLRTTVEAAIRSLDAQLRQAWLAYCDANVPRPQPEIVALLETRSGELTTELIDLRQLDQALAYYRGNVPIGRTGAAADLVARLARRRQLWSSFQIDDMPEEVRLFIQACSDRGAPLTLMTDRVSDWLAAQGLLAGYVIVPADRA